MIKFLKISLLLVAGAMIGIGGTLFATKRAQTTHVPYNEVVVQPTRKKTIKYSMSKYSSVTYKNPNQDLCVIAYMKFDDFYAYGLYKLEKQ